MTFVECWNVGSAQASWRPMQLSDVSAHLLEDWMPSLPVNVSSSVFGWPPHLLESISFLNRDILSLAAVAGRSERQWKGFLSWMVGVAGARHFLSAEYRWIAPVSAFYDDAIQGVDIGDWPGVFKPGALVAARPVGSAIRVRPDYLAIRSRGPGLGFDWAVAESKGTRRSLTGMAVCPTAWRAQVRNIELHLNDAPLPISRHLVIATRINPNALQPVTRRLQVRAWNSVKEATGPDLSSAAVEIAAAHLFGLLRNLRLYQNARAIALAPWRGRLRSLPSSATETEVSDLEERLSSAQAELATAKNGEQRNTNDFATSMSTDLGTVAIVLAGPLVQLVQRLQKAASIREAADSMEKADSRLNEWHKKRAPNWEDPRACVLPCGTAIQFPPTLGRRADRLE